MSFETEAFQEHDGNELLLEKMGQPFKRFDYFLIATIQEYNQQLTVFFPLIELFDFCCRVSSMTKDESVRILKYSLGYLKIDFGFSKKLILFACYIQELSNHVHYT